VSDSWLVSIPYWFVILTLVILPTIQFYRWLRHRRHVDQNLCRACGYDLRASPDRCPECGAENASRHHLPSPRRAHRHMKRPLTRRRAITDAALAAAAYLAICFAAGDIAFAVAISMDRRSIRFSLTTPSSN
jgi:predicted RNA-binding Zn-ribbon protein involved in translation (DUF1610 family)